jgi:ABC-type glycerol-3-phosphate transport system substrate-binding protein
MEVICMMKQTCKLVRISAVITLAIFLVFTLAGCSSSNDDINKKVRIVLVGNFIGDENAQKLISELEKKSGDKVYIDQILYTGNTPKSEQEFAFMQKLMVMLAAGEGDIYILDKKLFTNYAQNGAFYSLKSFVSKNKLDKFVDDTCYVKEKDKSTKDLYGLKADQVLLLKKYGFETKNKYIAIYVRSNKFSRAQKVLLALLNSK